MGVILTFMLVCVFATGCNGDGSTTKEPAIPGIGSSTGTTDTTVDTNGTTDASASTSGTAGTTVAGQTTASTSGTTSATTTKKPATTTTKTNTTTASTTKPTGTTEVAPSELVIFLDPGHGGKDAGTSREFDIDGDGQKELYKESDINLAVALKAKAKLEALGYKVVLSRTTDVEVSKADRPAKAIEANANMFISIHVNATAEMGTAAAGFEVFYTGRDTIKYDGRAFADLFTKEFTEIKDVPDSNKPGSLAYPNMKIRGTKCDDEDLYEEGNHLAVLNPTESYIPSVLLELGFISNDKDLYMLRSTYWQNFAAEAISDAVVQAHINGLYKVYGK